MDNRIHIVVNGFPEELPAGISIGDLIHHLDERDPHLIVERNGRFVYAQKYEETILAEGDRIELINPNFGG